MEQNNQLPDSQKKNHTSLILKEQLVRPALAILNEDFPKVKENNARELSELINFMIMILNIQKSNDEHEIKKMDQQMLLVGDLIRTKFGYLTIPEIKEAFKMLVSREFPGLKVFRILDCVSIGEVLQAYTDFRNESLRTYSHKKNAIVNALPEKTESEKKEIREKLIRIIYDDMVKDKFSNDAWLLYDELFNSFKISPTDEYKKELYNKQLELYANEQRNVISGKGTIASRSLLNDLKKKIESANPIQSVRNKCKSIIVCDYLKKNMYDFETFKKSIE